jgi:peptide/nickel transport system substrate-binding protein
MCSSRVISPILRTTRYLPIERHLQPGGRHKPIEWQVFRSRGLSLCLAIIFSSLVAIMPPGVVPTSANAQQTCRTIGDFQVCDRFLNEWSKQGSDQANVYVNGLPITSRRAEISLIDGKSYDTQWFERAKYEAHPENQAPYDIQLGLLGASLAEGRGIVDPNTHQLRNASDAAFVGIGKPADTDGTTKIWFPETRHSISGKILEYWNRYGGLSQFGFPLSEPFQEISEADSKTYTVQYFERNRFELHPENQAPYEVELGLLGVRQYKEQAVAGDNLIVAPPPGVKSSKDTLVVGIPNGPPSLPDQIDSVGALYYGALYDNLVHFDDNNNYFPEMAWYVPTIENGGVTFVGTGADLHLQIKYKMRQGMKWSDGVEITSNDVIYAYKTTYDPDFTGFGDNSYFGGWLHSIDNPDKYTVIANFLSLAQEQELYSKDPGSYSYVKPYIDAKEPYTNFEYYRVTEDMLQPEHSLGKVAPKDQASLGYFSDPNLMVTNGPFKLEQFDQNQIVLVPNPYYSLTAPPLLKNIVFRIIPDHDTLVAQLKSGDVDVVADGLTLDDFRQLGQEGLTVKSVPSQTWEHIDFNLDRPYFKDKVVRQAIAYAINRQKIVDQISFGLWQVSDTAIPPRVWDSMQNPAFAGQWEKQFPLRKYDYNPALANQMLDQAGWVRGPDGIRSKGGMRLSFNYETAGKAGGIRTQIQPLVQADLKAVGIEAKPQMLSPGDFFGTGANGVLYLRDFDFAEYAILFEPDASVYYDSNDIPGPENNYQGINVSGYRNAHFDELHTKDEFEIDRTKRAPLVAEMQSIYSEDLPSLPLFVQANINVYRPNLVNWDQSGWSVSALYKAGTIYFK